MTKYRDDRPVIYVSGPITADNAWLKEKNIRAAEEVGYLLGDPPYDAAPIVPHTACRFLGGTRDRQVFMEIDFAQLSRCDGMVLLPGWVDSEGCQSEVAYANQHDIPYIEITLSSFENSTGLIVDFLKSLPRRKYLGQVRATG